MINLLKRLIVLILLVIIPLLSVAVVRYHLYFSNPKSETLCQNDTKHRPIDDRNLVNRFSQALRFQTVSRNVGDFNANELVKFIDWIKKTYPTLHNSSLVRLEYVANYSLLYTIRGSDSSLKPYMLCGHLDVVPVEIEKWTVDPFKGVVKDGYLYGRGAIDVKDSVIGILEALEHLLKNENFRPRRGLIIAFGHDEETSGVFGAMEISRLLQSRYKELEFILDEGSFIMENAFPGVSKINTAFVAVSEKGYVTVQLQIKDNSLAGHSSMPHQETAIVKLAKAVSKFKATSHPSRFGGGPEVKLLESMSSYADFPFKYIYSNLWLFGYFINYFFSNDKMGNTLIRTTSAVTMINGGLKENVLPSEASALINHRIHPLDTVEKVLNFDRNLINDESIKLSIYNNISFEPHPISPFDDEAFGYNTISRSVKQIFNNTLVVPGTMVASTDTKHYLPLSKNIYRFTPIIMNKDEVKRFHGNDERINIDNYVKLVNFYHHVIITADQSELEKKRKVKDEL